MDAVLASSGEIWWLAAVVVLLSVLLGGVIGWCVFTWGGGSSLKERYDAAEAHVRDTEAKAAESERLARQCDDLRRDIADVRREHDGLEDARRELACFAREEETVLRRFARFRDLVQENGKAARDTMNELVRKETALSEQINAKQETLARLNDDLQQADDSRKELVRVKEALEQSKAEEAVARRGAEDAREEAQEAMRRKERFEHDHERLAEQVKTLSDAWLAARDKLDLELQPLREERSRAEAALTRVKEEAATAQRVAQEASEAAEAAGLRQKLLAHEIEQLEEQIKAKNGELARAGGGDISVSSPESSPRGSLGNLVTPPRCLSVPRGPARPNPDESEALREVLADIRSQGLEFHERVLWRLHTSLKVAQVSPITVLAGISGTGKTQLPRAYAEAIGMYLQVVPVQPRWDSPMDLVGSYDYVDKRYQATELARLLWSFDPVHRDGLEGEQDERMAIVLLDEMNLARPEYYFSDFLSRLELRRSGDGHAGPSPETMVELDVPHGEGEAPDVLYPSERVLWVGTMNEDESTQTLSDKVLDRSNVIRFPRPPNLHSEVVVVSPDPGAGAPRRELTATQWNEWCEGRTVSSEAITMIERINERVMARAGRPYAHRMSQAMRLYVSRYPVRDWRRALADQVDMRVLTKLTGLDGANEGVSSALEELRKICEGELREEALAEAIREATSVMHDVGTFVWTGYRIE